MSVFTDHLEGVHTLQRAVNIGRSQLPGRLRPEASLAALDVTEWFGDTSGGIRTYLLQKAQYVATRPCLRHILVVPGAHDAISDSDGVRMYRLQGPPIPRQKPYRFMLATRSLSRIAQHEQPDVIEVGSPFVVPWIVRRATREFAVPLICFYHSNLPRLFAPRTGHDSAGRRALYRASWSYMRRLDRLFALTIVTSSFSARDLAREGIERVAKVPLGVDLEQFHPEHRQAARETRAAHGLPEGPLAGFVGRFAAEKELRMLLDGWAQVERRTGARLALVGTGPLEQSLRSHAYGSRVLFVPYQSDRQALAELHASFDLYISPGRIETFGLSALEALASGTPVLTANDGGVHEQVETSGAGAAFEAGDASSLAETAIAMFQGDLAMLGARGRRYAEQEHAWSTVFDRLFDVYRGVLAR